MEREETWVVRTYAVARPDDRSHHLGMAVRDDEPRAASDVRARWQARRRFGPDAVVTFAGQDPVHCLWCKELSLG
ncbi:MAG: hypothetical protein NT080_02210 [Spirochaetes bacterium]|nr:hypothetical protein [Spirochaetota bacterium]